jgi:uncharacterized protein (TIGR03435 family)
MEVEEMRVFVAKRRRRWKFGVVAVIACAGAWMALASPAAFAQGSAAPSAVATSEPNVLPGRTLAFDVVSIKPIEKGAPPANGWIGVQNHPDGVEFSYRGLRDLVQYAYGEKRLPLADQITGVPDWARTQAWDISAKMSAEDIAEFQKLDKAGQQQWREAMMQTMLADRFQLKIHRGTRQAPIYEMVVAKGGMKMKDAATDANPPIGKGEDGKVSHDVRWEKDSSLMQAYSMESLVGLLSEPGSGLGRPVVDKTGLTGSYDFTFDWSVYSRSVHVSDGESGGVPWDAASAIFTALGKIGLKLQPATGTLDTIVIEHVEKPSEN